MANSHVPKFGNWEGEEVPYTTYFDNARKGKKSDHTFQTDLQEVESKGQKAPESKTPKHERRSSREEFEPRRSTSSPKATGHKPSIDSQEVVRPRHDRRVSREEGDMRRLSQENSGHRNNSNSPRHHLGSNGETPRRVAHRGSDRSVDHSPHHPHSRERVGGKNSGISSPSWERKASSEGSHGLAPSTPGRSRLRSVTRGDDSPDRGPAVPKFGDWDETDPAAAEGYTHIFNRVREEKNSETGKVPVMPTEASYPNGHKQYGNDNAKGCGCFPWGKR